MSDKLAAARAGLQALDQAVAAGGVGDGRRQLWGGAGLVIVTAMPQSHYNESLKYVVTPHAETLSWLVSALWEACRPLFDSMTKFEFFGRLGNAAHRYQQRAGDDQNARDLLGAVVHEAYEILGDVEHGRFYTLIVAPPGIVHDDLLPDSGHDDAASEAELERMVQAERPRLPGNKPDPRLPFFAYGIFSPGQIAFFQIKSYVHQVTDAHVAGMLRIRDGVPVLDATARSEVVNGYRIEFDDAFAEPAYQAIQRMEPSTQYRWDNDGEMNVLVGRKPKRGSRPMAPGWSSWRDPAFLVASKIVEENLAEQFVWDDLRPFYRLQGAYMVLWSSIERYISLRYGLGRNEQVFQRVKRLAGEAQFEASLRATDPSATAKLRKLYRSDDPTEVVTFEPSGPPEKAITYLYQVRSNVTHRGKEELLDWDLLHTATAEVLRIFLDVLHAAERDSQWTGTSSR
ncbi:hypothetical protein [Mycolicibacter kumamotonensis]|nr:hypothetical protein [Mycolicibacter kumamotonensis]